MEELKTSRVHFLSEQDGPSEQQLKTKLIECCLLSKTDVSSAYLARVSYRETPGLTVALCLRGGKKNAAAIVECVGATFRRVFRSTEHLDIFFLDESQLKEIDKVAKPFYVAA
jgi:hypothetical protein